MLISFYYNYVMGLALVTKSAVSLLLHDHNKVIATVFAIYSKKHFKIFCGKLTFETNIVI